MNKKKTIIILVIIMLLIPITVFLVRLFDKERNNLCESIASSQREKENFVILFERQGSNPNDNVALNEIIDKYDIKDYRLSVSQKENNCFKTLLLNNSLYEEINSDTSLIILYKEGKYVGASLNASNYNQIEDYLTEKGVIEKKEIQDKVSFLNFQNNIKNKYIVFLISTEDHRNMVNEYASSVFTNDKYDIVNINGDEGKKIYQYMSEKYIIDSVFPQGFYIKNYALISSLEVSDNNSDYVKFKNSIK